MTLLLVSHARLHPALDEAMHLYEIDIGQQFGPTLVIAPSWLTGD
jgi:hypothetical protein